MNIFETRSVRFHRLNFNTSPDGREFITSPGLPDFDLLTISDPIDRSAAKAEAFLHTKNEDYLDKHPDSSHTKVQVIITNTRLPKDLQAQH